MVEKPFRNLFTFVGITGEPFCFWVPILAEGAGNFRIVVHCEQEYVSIKFDLWLMKQKLRAVNMEKEMKDKLPQASSRGIDPSKQLKHHLHFHFAYNQIYFKNALFWLIQILF
jgi:hypothetical protein